jgi:hypothetical protein
MEKMGTAALSISTSERGGLYKIGQGTIVWVVSLIPLIYTAMTISFTDIQYIKTFGLSLALSFVVYQANDYIIPQSTELLLKANLSGKDLNKPGEMKDKKPM